LAPPSKPAGRRPAAAAPQRTVSIVGGTGLLGYHAALECLRRGHAVQCVAQRDIELGAWFPERIALREADVFRLPPRELVRLFEGVDAMVYAVGPDDRVVPRAPAYDFFHERLVQACGRVVAAAREAGVRRCTVLGSYFTHFDRRWPHKRLAAHHPYIRCRVEQAERVFREGGGTMAVSVLELPYIFGVMPGREPLWKRVLLDRLRRMPVIVYPRGGSAMIAVGHVAEAIAGAVERGRDGTCYPVGDENLSWDEMIAAMLHALGLERRIVHLPALAGAWLGRGVRWSQARHGRESGLEPERLFADLMTEELYLDPLPTAKALGHGRGGLREAIAETVRACYPGRAGAAASSATASPQ
jgi:nucleoside-diphosphate-sugar epimerase